MDLCWLDKSDFTSGNLIFGDYFPKFSGLFFPNLFFSSPLLVVTIIFWIFGSIFQNFWTFSTLANFLNFVLILKYWIKCKRQEQTSSKTCLGFEIRQQAKRLKWQKFLDREKLVSPLEQFAIMSESLIYGFYGASYHSKWKNGWSIAKVCQKFSLTISNVVISRLQQSGLEIWIFCAFA